MREVRIYAWMLFVLFCFLVGVRTLLVAVLSSGWAWTIAGGMTLFSYYFFEEVYQRRDEGTDKGEKQNG